MRTIMLQIVLSFITKYLFWSVDDKQDTWCASVQTSALTSLAIRTVTLTARGETRIFFITCIESVWFLHTFGPEWLRAIVASYFRREEIVLMAFIQTCLRGQGKNAVLTHGGLCVKSWCGKGERHRREMRGKVPLMILNQTQPFPVPRARAAHCSPYMVMVFAWRESLGLWIRSGVEIPLY